MVTTSIRWAVQWNSRNGLDGVSQYFVWDGRGGGPMLFRSRRLAREWIREHYGYIATRADLRREPYGWRLPRAIRVRVVLVEVAR